jgi:nicotinate-nucleotide adenylyltransferase
MPARRPAVYGFLGGSFDPVHKSHIALARAARRERGLKAVYLVPAARSPFKDGAPRASAADRLAMLRRAVRGVPGLRVGDWEIHRPGPSYTHATLRRLRRAFPGRRWEVLLGEDAWAGFRGWRRWREIARRHPLVVARRPGSQPAPRAGVHFLKARLRPISSTAARAAIAQNGPWRGMVPEGAARVIESRRLYRAPAALSPAGARALRRFLTGERWRHSKAVALWARDLAQRHGVDPVRAERAGWWHDVAKNWSPGRLRAYARRKKIPIPWGGTKSLDPLLHGPVGARWARDRGFLTDPAALAAIARHTVGARRMSRLDKILYVADFSSPDRRYPEAARVRRWAVADLDRALRAALRAKLLHTLERGRIVMHTSVGLWNHLLSGSR